MKDLSAKETETFTSLQIFSDHFDDFEQSYENCYIKEYGFYRSVISRVVRKYLECGDLHKGFARVRCPDCHHEYLTTLRELRALNAAGRLTSRKKGVSPGK